MDEELDNVIVLNDEAGNEVKFEFLDLVELDDEPNQLWDKVDSLLKDDARRSEMALAAVNLGMPDAADQIARAILKMEKYYAKNAE